MDKLGGILFEVNATDAHRAAARLGLNLQATGAA